MAKKIELTGEDLINEFTSGLPSEQVEALKQVLAYEPVQQKIRDGYLRQSEFSRRMDELREEQKKLETQQEESRRYYESQVALSHNNKAEYDRLLAEKEELEAKLAGGTQSTTDWSYSYGGQTVSEDYVPKSVLEKRIADLNKQHEEMLLNTQNNAINLMAKMTNLAQKHYAEFGEPLDTNELTKFAINNNIPLETAYERSTSERRSEVLERKHAEAIQKAREDGAREALSKHNLPVVDNRPKEIHALRPPKDIPKTREERVARALEEFQAIGG